MAAVDNSIVSKIKKLLALSNNQNGTPEGDLAADFAARLMLQHAVSMADVDNLSNTDKIITYRFILSQKEQWIRQLAFAVATFCNCKMTFCIGAKDVDFYGYKSDCEVAEYLFEIFSREIRSRCDVYLNDVKSNDLKFGNSLYSQLAPRQKASIRISFCMTATIILGRRLDALMKKTQVENTTTFGLVLTRKNQVDIWYEENVQTRKSPKTKIRWSNAGERAGNDIDIIKGVSSGDKPTRMIN